MIRILHKLPGLVNEAKVREIEPTLSAMQAMVTPEGSSRALIELVHIAVLQEQGIDLFVNEEGKFNGCKPNFAIFGGRDLVMGPSFFVSSNDEGETVGLSDSQLTFAQGWLKGQPQSIQ